jgi:hypothetical protein
MSQGAIFSPVGVLAFWTFAVLLLIPFRRFAAGSPLARDTHDPADGPLPVADRAMMHLLELPVLFYVVCLMFFVTATLTPLVLQLAWVYVAFRVAQTLIHLTYNNVIHRLTAFSVSNFILVALWIMFFFPVIMK